MALARWFVAAPTPALHAGDGRVPCCGRATSPKFSQESATTVKERCQSRPDSCARLEFAAWESVFS